MDDQRLSRYLPSRWLKPRPQFANGWELAAAAYVTAIWMYVIGVLIADLSNLTGSFRDDLAQIFDQHLLIAAPATITAITLAARRRAMDIDEHGLWRLDAAFTLAIPLGALFVLAGVVGFFTAFADFGPGGNGGGGVYDLLIHLGAVVLGGVAIVWPLGELAQMREPRVGPLPSGPPPTDR